METKSYNSEKQGQKAYSQLQVSSYSYRKKESNISAEYE